MRIHWAQIGDHIVEYVSQIPESHWDWEYILWIEFYDWDYAEGAVVFREEYNGNEGIHWLPKQWTFA